MIDLSQHKLELDYPCNWEYKLIVHSHEEVLKGVKEVLLQREYTLTPSKTSKKGKFLSFTLETIVHNEDDRVTIYELFGRHESIKMVL
jgi:putative lipoic acid-binding regulatory protein